MTSCCPGSWDVDVTRCLQGDPGISASLVSSWANVDLFIPELHLQGSGMSIRRNEIGTELITVLSRHPLPGTRTREFLQERRCSSGLPHEWTEPGEGGAGREGRPSEERGTVWVSRHWGALLLFGAVGIKNQHIRRILVCFLNRHVCPSPG